MKTRVSQLYLTSSYLSSTAFNVLRSPCLTHPPATAAFQILHLLHVCGAVMSFTALVQLSLSFQPKKNSDPDGEPLTSPDISKMTRQQVLFVKLQKKTSGSKLKILWLHDVMSGRPLSPKKNQE